MIDPIDLQLIVAIQEGLPIVARPYKIIAGQLDLEEQEIIGSGLNLLFHLNN